MQNRQTLALRKWEGRDAELPRLLQQHKDELRSYQEQIKKVVITTNLIFVSTILNLMRLNSS